MGDDIGRGRARGRDRGTPAEMRPQVFIKYFLLSFRQFASFLLDVMTFSFHKLHDEV